jgi:hypothetical protein
MKLYVGARRRVFVADAGAADYVLCAEGAAGARARVAFAILADHLGDRERALAARWQFERTFGARLRAPFWTLKESEVSAALERGGDPRA